MSTVWNFEIELSDIDRGMYDTLTFPLAQHPSETVEYLVARALAYALEFTEGLTFPPGGLSTPDNPALWVHDLTGQLTQWIEIGGPSPARVHKACKAADRVAIYHHKDLANYLSLMAKERVYSPEKVEIFGLDTALIGWIRDRVQKRTALTLSRNDGELYVEMGGESTSAAVVRQGWPAR